MAVNYLKNAAGHFKTITYHKYKVMQMCFKCGIYKQGLLHDMSKYSPTEFTAGIRYYAGGVASPNNKERKAIGYSTAWLHHKGRNKHHFEYWRDYSTDPNHKGIIGIRIPKKYMAEMFCDRVCASKVYNGENFKRSDVLNYYNNGVASTILHPESARYLEFLMHIYEKKGEDYVCRYIRKDLKENISGY